MTVLPFRNELFRFSPEEKRRARQRRAPTTPNEQTSNCISAGRWSAFEQVINQINYIRNI
jgi:hypothetical protein